LAKRESAKTKELQRAIRGEKEARTGR